MLVLVSTISSLESGNAARSLNAFVVSIVETLYRDRLNIVQFKSIKLFNLVLQPLLLLFYEIGTQVWYLAEVV